MGRWCRLDSRRDGGVAVVTAWGPQTIAKFAQAAGFSGEALHDAVALALAASNGADHYRHNPVAHPGAERRGLWAIRVDQVPFGITADLFDPENNAMVTQALWHESGGAFSWHPTWINGAAARERQWVTPALRGRTDDGRVVHAHGFGDVLARMVARANAYGMRLDTGQLIDD